MKKLTHYKLDIKKWGIQWNLQIALLVAIVLALVLAVYVAFQVKETNSLFNWALEENNSLSTQLDELKKERENLTQLSKYQQSIIDSYGGQIESITSTVGVLKKLSETDKELLKKYSKVYFLNENYVPAKLTQIETPYVFKQSNGNLLIHAEVWTFLKKMMDAARSDGVDLLVLSAFRSFDTQESLKSDYTFAYGAGTANQFSADQGYSEHQLGTSIDMTTTINGASLSKFESSSTYKWMTDNAYKYGFTLSYPKGNNYYKFEPWHWRFVGVTLANRLYSEGKYFYDLDQREIDTYLIKLFD